MGDVEPGRKLVTDDQGTFYQSSGYNTGFFSFIQSISRTFSNATGWDATSIGTKAAIERLNQATLTNLTDLRKCYESLCDRVPYINRCLKTHLIALNTVVGLAKKSIANLAKTYGLEKDTAMMETTRTEVKTCEKIEEVIKSFNKMLETEDFTKTSGGSDRSRSPVVKRVALTPPKKKMKPLLEEIQSRLAFLQDDHNHAKSTFLSMFEKVGTLDEMQNLKAYFDSKNHTLSDDFVELIKTMKHSAVNGLKLCLPKAMRDKKLAVESQDPNQQDKKVSVLDELLKKAPRKK